MDPFESSGEILPPEGATEIFEPEPFEASETSSQEEIMGLFFPADQKIPVTIYAYLLRSLGKTTIKAVMSQSSPDLKGIDLEECEIRSTWSVPTAAQMDEYRSECSSYQPESRSIMVNSLAIRDLIVANHLKELLLPPKYKPFPFKYTRPDRLSGDTVKQLKLMHSGIYDTLYTEFLSEACLIV